MSSKLALFVLPLYIVSALLMSCSSKPDEFKVLKKTNVPVSASLPEPLIRELSSHFLQANPHLKLDLDKVVAKFGFYQKVQWPVSIKVWPQTTSLKIARDFQTKDETTRIDLSQFISQLNQKGSDFYLETTIQTEKFNKLYVYFLPSFSEKQKCNKFYEITEYYHTSLSKGALVTTDNEHYLKNYMGTYLFFSVLGEDRYQLNLVQITDSSKEKKLCQYF